MSPLFLTVLSHSLCFAPLPPVLQLHPWKTSVWKDVGWEGLEGLFSCIHPQGEALLYVIPMDE